MAARSIFRSITAYKAPFTASFSAWKSNHFGVNIHTSVAKEAENSWTSKFMTSLEGSMNNEMKDFGNGFQPQQFSEGTLNEGNRFGKPRYMNFVKGALEEDKKQFARGVQHLQYTTEEKLDIIHIKLLKNNTFVTITDSKGNKKAGVSSGSVEELKGGAKLSRFVAEATAEHAGTLARTLGLKSVIVRVNGFTHFKKKRQAILGWKDGYNAGRGDRCPIQYIEDTTRKPHNGCRLRKKRRY